MVLAINTALRKESVALASSPSEAKDFLSKKNAPVGRSTGTVISEKMWTSNADESKKVLPALKRVLGNIPIQTLKGILVVQGPGSFTATRIGIVIANTLAFVLQIPIMALTVPELWRKRCLGKKGVLLLNQGQGKVYVEALSWKFHVRSQSLERILSKLPRKQSLVFFGELTPEQKNVFEQKRSPAWKFLGDKGLKSFGEVAASVPPKAGPSYWGKPQVSPIYWNPPSITLPLHA